MRTSLDSDDFLGPDGSATQAELKIAPGSYLNPVLDEDFPDPALILAPDGYYYA